MGDLNIDTSDKTKDTSCYLSDLCDTFSLKNIINGKTCFKKTTGTSIDILLTNRPRSFLRSGIYETGLSDYHKLICLEKLKPFINTFLSKFIAAYREIYSSSHVLIRLTENWKQALDENFVVGTVLMDLSKAFDCTPCDLLIATLYAYKFSEKSAVFLCSY